jgi:hypothetical protein
MQVERLLRIYKEYEERREADDPDLTPIQALGIFTSRPMAEGPNLSSSKLRNCRGCRASLRRRDHMPTRNGRSKAMPSKILPRS